MRKTKLSEPSHLQTFQLSPRLSPLLKHQVTTQDMQREVWNCSPSSVLKVSVMAGMLEGVAVLKCSSQTQVKTTQDMQREVWNSSPSSVLKVSVMAGMLEGVAVLKCSSQIQVQTTSGAQSKAINTITYKLSSSFWPRHEFPFWGLEKPRVTRPHGSSLHVR